MFLKEFLRISFSNVKRFNMIYDDGEDLKFGIVNLCNLLQKDMLLLEVFVKDPLHKLLEEKSKRVVHFKSFNCYLFETVDAVNIFEQSNFESIRYLNIFAIEERDIGDNPGAMIKSSAFSIELDNYLEHTKININFMKYDDATILKLPIK